MKRIPKRYRKWESPDNQLIGLRFRWMGKPWTVLSTSGKRARIVTPKLYGGTQTEIDLRLLPTLVAEGERGSTSGSVFK